MKNLNPDFTLGNCIFESVKLTKNADLDKYKYTGYGIGFDSHSEFLFTDGSYGKMSLFLGLIWAHLCTLIIREKIYCIGLTHGLDDPTLTGEAKHPINFKETRKRFVLSLHYNGSNSFLFLNATKVYQFKAKNSEIKENALCLGNVSKDFTIKKT